MKNRVTRSEFSELTGISKSTFYERYRWSPKWQRELDLRTSNDDGRLTMDRDSVMELRRRRLGSRATGRSPRADRLGEHAERADQDAA